MKKIIIEISNEQLLGSCEEIVIKIDNTAKEHNSQIYFSHYIQEQIENWREKKHHRTAATYQSAKNSFMTFRQQEDILLADIDNKVIEDYEKDLIKKGIVKNSSSFYMRIIRAVYKKAVNEDLITDKHPFRNVYTGVDKTAKRAIDLDAIKAIKAYTSHKKSDLFARDLFIFSFYTRGMSFADIAHLKRSDLTYGYLTYRRKKTGSIIKIKWEPQMQEIVERYQDDSSPYLLPILTSESQAQQKTEIQTCQRKTNRHLKHIAQAIGLDINLTMYVARHAWASIALDLQIPIRTISDGMGHSTERMTQIYLKTISTSHIDNANRLILDALEG